MDQLSDNITKATKSTMKTLCKLHLILLKVIAFEVSILSLDVHMNLNYALKVQLLVCANRMKVQ